VLFTWHVSFRYLAASRCCSLTHGSGWVQCFFAPLLCLSSLSAANDSYVDAPIVDLHSRCPPRSSPCRFVSISMLRDWPENGKLVSASHCEKSSQPYGFMSSPQPSLSEWRPAVVFLCEYVHECICSTPHQDVSISPRIAHMYATTAWVEKSRGEAGKKLLFCCSEGASIYAG